MRENTAERSAASVVRTAKVGVEARRITGVAKHCGRCRRGKPVTCQVTYPRSGEPQYEALCGICRHAGRRSSTGPSSRTMAANQARLNAARLRAAEHTHAMSLTRSK